MSRIYGGPRRRLQGGLRCAVVVIVSVRIVFLTIVISVRIYVAVVIGVVIHRFGHI